MQLLLPMVRDMTWSQMVEVGMSAGLEFEDMGNKRWLRTGMFCSGWGVRVAQDGLVCLQLCQRLFWSKLRLGLDLQISWEALGKAYAMIHEAGPCVHCTVDKPWLKPSLLLWQEIGNLCSSLLKGNLTMYISSFWFPNISGDLLLSQSAAFTNPALIHG